MSLNDNYYSSIGIYEKYIYRCMSKMKQNIIRKMDNEFHYYYDFISNGFGKNCKLAFNTDYNRVYFKNWKAVKDWMNNVVID